jgi:pimeloyl-ACP methyl ester carboxylesterase
MNRRTFALRGVGATIAAMIPAADAQSQDGPCILVAHSYGGSVITEAGTDPSAVGLVYIAAHMPDAGESETDDGKCFPSDVSKSNAIRKTADGFTYLDPTQFPAYFAADMPADRAAFMARSQVLNAAVNFSAVITKPAWRVKPSWMLVAKEDRIINPELERWYAKRANSHKLEVAGRQPLSLRFKAEGSRSLH